MAPIDGFSERVSCTDSQSSAQLVERLDVLSSYSQNQCTEIIVAGSTNAGKSSLINGLLSDRCDSKLCRINIKAETAHCTEFHFKDGDDYAIDGEGMDRKIFFEKLTALQKRADGSSSEVSDIKVTVPTSPYFDTKGLAVVVDTPGFTENLEMEQAVLKRIRESPGKGSQVLVYCVSATSGLSMELSTQDKTFLKDAGVPANRTIVVATHYDTFVDEQTDENADASDDDLYGDDGKNGLSYEEKLLQAERSFTNWAAQLVAKNPGLTVLPFGRVGKTYTSKNNGALSAALRQQMAIMVRKAVAERVSVAREDALLRRWNQIVREDAMCWSGARRSQLRSERPLNTMQHVATQRLRSERHWDRAQVTRRVDGDAVKSAPQYTACSASRWSSQTAGAGTSKCTSTSKCTRNKTYRDRPQVTRRVGTAVAERERSWTAALLASFGF
jgi:predicted GTPase